MNRRVKPSAVDPVPLFPCFGGQVPLLDPESEELTSRTAEPTENLDFVGNSSNAPEEVTGTTVPLFFTVEDLAELAEMTPRNVRKAIAEQRLKAEPTETKSGHHKGRHSYRIAHAEAFRVFPKAQSRWEARNYCEKVLADQGTHPGIAPPADPAAIQTLKDWQRRRMDARLGVLRYIEKVEEELAAHPHPRWKLRAPTRDRAIMLVCADAVTGRLPEDIQALLPIANARAGQSGERTLSRRTLQRWAAEAKQGFDHLAPKAKVWIAPAWLPQLLDFYRRPQKPSLASCVDLLAGVLPAGSKAPSIDAARRALAKVGAVERERGRMLPRELKSQKPFRRREKPEFPFDVLIADGHTFDAEVAHPLTGQPFRPEITTVVDVCTGRVVGWSAWEKECSWAVIDALRQACLMGGVPCIFYSDNGPGYVNIRMDALKVRLGFEHHTGIPYNSQARGVIERLQKTLWVELCAKSFSTYVGAAMDRQARQIVFKATRKGVPMLPSWQNFIVFMDQCVEAYNARPHRSCPKALTEDGRKRHLSPLGFWQQHESLGWKPEGLPLALEDFRPEEIRTVIRGEIIPQDSTTNYAMEGTLTIEALVDGVVKRTWTGVTGTTQVYTLAQRTADDADLSKPVTFRITPINGSYQGTARTTPQFVMG